MREWARLWALLAVVYLTATEAIRLLSTERLDRSAMLLASAIAVPTLQLALIALAARLRRGDACRFGDRFGLAGFFGAWALALVGLGLMTVAVGLGVFLTVDLTATMVTTLLFVPAAQAAVFCVATSSRRWSRPDWRTVLSHPLGGPILWIDSVMLPAGWIWAGHPLLGMAEAAVMQRRWMATKCLAAAVTLTLLAIRAEAPHGQPGRRAFAAAAVVMTLLGLDGFFYWMFESAAMMPDPIAIQPLPIIWLEVYGLASGLFLWSSLRVARAFDSAAPTSASLQRAGILLMFAALLAVLMNGFLSWLPVAPWAGIALTCGSLSATALALSGFLALKPIHGPVSSVRI